MTSVFTVKNTKNINSTGFITKQPKHADNYNSKGGILYASDYSR